MCFNFCKKQDEQIVQLSKQIEVMESALLPHPKELYYNDKYPKSDITYKGRFMPVVGMLNIDVRNFFTVNDSMVNGIAKNITGTDNEKALKCLTWVIDNFKYVSDKSVVGLDEYWMFPYESILSKKGDCDDGAILLANLLLASGISYWKIRLTAGETTAGGHCYVTYYYEEGDYWVTLDWCFYPNKKPVSDRVKYSEDQLYKNVWFSFNQKYSYSQGLNTQAKKYLK